MAASADAGVRFIVVESVYSMEGDSSPLDEYAALGAELYDPSAPPDLTRASAIVVPGVGHFGATSALDHAWVAAIRAHVAKGRPLLGICLGLQVLFDESEEQGPQRGLGLVKGKVVRFQQYTDSAQWTRAAGA